MVFIIFNIIKTINPISYFKNFLGLRVIEYIITISIDIKLANVKYC